MHGWTKYHVILLAILLALLAGCAPSQRPVITTKPTPKQFRYVGEINERLGESRLSSPTSITCDQSNNLYIVDQGNNRVVKLGPGYQFIKENGGFGLGLSGLSRPSDIASDGGINFYILDQGNNRIVRSDYDLVFADEVRFNADPDLVLLGKIAAIGYSRMGRMYLLDPDNLKVIVLDKDDKIEQELFPPGGFSHCSAIYVAKDGEVYVYDRADNTIFKFDTFGNADGKIELQDVGQVGGFVVLDNEIIATDKVKNEVVVFDSQGVRLTAIGSTGSGPQNLNAPTGLALCSSGKLFVCDTGNNRIMIYDVAAI